MIKTETYLPEKGTQGEVDDLFHPYHFGARPFLKWAGGKGQLIEKFQQLYPQDLKDKKIKTFYEPFLGSGAVFFNVAQNFDIQNAYLFDINEELVLTYIVIQREVSKLIELLYSFQKNYHQLSQEKRQEFYYHERANFNEKKNLIDFNRFSEAWIFRAAQIIFLNRTCFNGLYRVNSKGEFNSPMGEYDNPRICDEHNLLAVNQILQIANIKRSDFKDIVFDFKDNSFVYFDPPYRPISKTANFKAYSKFDFSDDEQMKLAKLFIKLHEKGVKVMLSNSDPKNIDHQDNFFDEIYSSFNITRIPARRMINSNGTKRGSINEIVVTNYDIQNGER